MILWDMMRNKKQVKQLIRKILTFQQFQTSTKNSTLNHLLSTKQSTKITNLTWKLTNFQEIIVCSIRQILMNFFKKDGRMSNHSRAHWNPIWNWTTKNLCNQFMVCKFPNLDKQDWTKQEHHKNKMRKLKVLEEFVHK